MVLVLQAIFSLLNEIGKHEREWAERREGFPSDVAASRTAKSLFDCCCCCWLCCCCFYCIEAVRVCDAFYLAFDIKYSETENPRLSSSVPVLSSYDSTILTSWCLRLEPESSRLSLMGRLTANSTFDLIFKFQRMFWKSSQNQVLVWTQLPINLSYVVHAEFP